ncbi:hypothetical protein [Variovorax boronicumulans]|uniref:hypothetical protein n=1 Tax=Variovorax boronicumulans TaxID=436515 RepID=UPI0012E613E2|nr:hypothetical protein [Variovorax boronicumulans]GER12233.1 hypothetical protein VHAB30_34110 [Variovorax boronicumulans]
MSDARPGDAPNDHPATTEGGPLESAAFPPLLRTLAVVLVVDLFAFALWSLPSLRTTSWSATSLFVFGVAGLCVIWVGYWIVYSRTRLEGDVLTQTWLWNKRVSAQDVAQLKLVHIRMLERVIAPRLLVRRRFGGITWFHAYDPQVLIAFGEQVAMRTLPSAPPPSPAPDPASK